MADGRVEIKTLAYSEANEDCSVIRENNLMPGGSAA
jgi:hypothetical protein